jgi:hypothetical protein
MRNGIIPAYVHRWVVITFFYVFRVFLNLPRLGRDVYPEERCDSILNASHKNSLLVRLN